MKNVTQLYKNRFSDQEEERRKAIWWVITHDFLQKFVEESDTVIDPACGYGEFISYVHAKRKIAMDMNSDSGQCVNKDVEFHQGNCLDLLKEFPETADIVFTSNFLEHLPDKKSLETLLTGVWGALKSEKDGKAGRYLILGPNLRYIPGRYWDYYDHNLGLTHLSLIEALRLFEFEIEYCLDKFLPYTVKSALPTHPFLVKMYLHFPLAWRILGSQFFIIARKKG